MRALCALAVVLLAACGGGSGQTSTTGLSRSLARDLAARADAVAAALDRGDQCSAYRLGQALVRRVTAVRQEGRIPAQLDRALTTSVGALQARLSCPPPPQPVVTEAGPPKIPPGQLKKHPGKDKKKKKQHGGEGQQ
jgi:hypothetical protein